MEPSGRFVLGHECCEQEQVEIAEVLRLPALANPLDTVTEHWQERSSDESRRPTELQVRRQCEWFAR